MNKLLSWPIVALTCTITIVVVLNLVPKEPGCHEGYLFTLASYISMSTTIIAEAILDRLHPGIFKQGKALHYRFWLVCTALGSLLLFLIFRVYPIPVWQVHREILFLSYVALFALSLGSAWLIARTKPKQSQ